MSPVWLLLLCVAVCHQTELNGSNSSGKQQYKRCPNFHVTDRLSLNRFSGVWYHMASYEHNNYGYVYPSRCALSKYTYNAKLGVVGIEIKEILLRGFISGYITIKGKGKPRNVNNQRQWSVTLNFPDKPQIKTEYYIFGTDYTNFAIITGCLKNDKERYRTMFAYILTRVQDFPHSPLKCKIEKKIAPILDYLGLTRSMFKNTDQNNCSSVTTTQPDA